MANQQYSITPSNEPIKPVNPQYTQPVQAIQVQGIPYQQPPPIVVVMEKSMVVNRLPDMSEANEIYIWLQPDSVYYIDILLPASPILLILL